MVRAAASELRVTAERNRPPVLLRLTPLGWITFAEAAVLLGSIAWQPKPAAAAAGAALLAALLLALWLAPRRLRGVEARWLLPSQILAGSEVTLGASITAADGSPPCTIEAWDPRVRALRPVARLAGTNAQPTRIRWSTRFPKRGQIELPPLTISGVQPFGLALVRLASGVRADLVVWPALGRVRSAMRTRLAQWLGGIAPSGDPGGDDLARLRAWHPGDPLARIHWRASARHRELLVAERHAPAARRLALALDPNAPAVAFERLIAAAATLVDDLAQQGWEISLHGGFAAVGSSASGIAGTRDRLLSVLALANRGGAPLADSLPRGVPVLILLADATPEPPCPGPSLCLRDRDLPRLIHLPKRVRLGA